MEAISTAGIWGRPSRELTACVIVEPNASSPNREATEMNDQSPPLKLDMRLVLESVAGALAFVLAGIAAVNIAQPWDVLIPLMVGAILVFINRLLGRSSEAAVNELRRSINQLVASNEVLKTDATPTVIRAAEQTAVAVGGPPKDAGKPTPTPPPEAPAPAKENLT